MRSTRENVCVSQIQLAVLCGKAARIDKSKNVSHYAQSLTAG
jgi:hypothetical protein